MINTDKEAHQLEVPQLGCKTTGRSKEEIRKNYIHFYKFRILFKIENTKCF